MTQGQTETKTCLFALQGRSLRQEQSPEEDGHRAFPARRVLRVTSRAAVARIGCSNEGVLPVFFVLVSNYSPPLFLLSESETVARTKGSSEGIPPPFVATPPSSDRCAAAWTRPGDKSMPVLLFSLPKSEASGRTG